MPSRGTLILGYPPRQVTASRCLTLAMDKLHMLFAMAQLSGNMISKKAVTGRYISLPDMHSQGLYPIPDHWPKYPFRKTRPV